MPSTDCCDGIQFLVRRQVVRRVCGAERCQAVEKLILAQCALTAWKQVVDQGLTPVARRSLDLSALDQVSGDAQQPDPGLACRMKPVGAGERLDGHVVEHLDRGQRCPLAVGELAGTRRGRNKCRRAIHGLSCCRVPAQESRSRDE
jgi:hypothetical protein